MLLVLLMTIDGRGGMTSVSMQIGAVTPPRYLGQNVSASTLKPSKYDRLREEIWRKSP
jgi:hypothetical protein